MQACKLKIAEETKEIDAKLDANILSSAMTKAEIIEKLKVVWNRHRLLSKDTYAVANRAAKADAALVRARHSVGELQEFTNAVAKEIRRKEQLVTSTDAQLRLRWTSLESDFSMIQSKYHAFNSFSEFMVKKHKAIQQAIRNNSFWDQNDDSDLLLKLPPTTGQVKKILGKNEG
eukprot:TRINITY_DN12625_c0_g1_i1.p1 TRINITY_DN12625_c0_g1~~TRINITY_DN12625_c0_g1_i1.p1  ORF type:complete len:174 (+),score=35.60 TRINITY_DN12625_c0_g1_i1:172-693(+)